MNSFQSITVVAPVFNEESGIEKFVTVLFNELDKISINSDVILVNDGSTDSTAEKLNSLQELFSERLTILHLSRNFGHQAALTAGMDESTGDAVITLDADMQHPPSLIPLLLDKWKEGADVVQTIRQDSKQATFLKKFTSKYFYNTINFLSSTQIEPAAADFRLLSRAVVNVFKYDIRERDRFMRGLVAWVGFKTELVPFTAPPRFAGTTKYTWNKMFSFARVGLVSFSRVPLKISIWLGVILSAMSIFYGLYAIYANFFLRNLLNPGWASIIVSITFLGGCQMVFMGLIGEYISTIFDEIKARPIYIVSEKKIKTVVDHAPVTTRCKSS
jgi:glycosyltransferase involved in cell wall biosynthesis